MFEATDARCVKSAALYTCGAGGPSGTNAHCWRRLCTMLGRPSNDLCHSLSLVARRLCTTYVNPACLSPLLACHLVALDKNPHVGPIGICETSRRIISKAVLSVIHYDVPDAAGALQLCAGQATGVESAIHTVRQCYSDASTECALLVDAANAFNTEL